MAKQASPARFHRIRWVAFFGGFLDGNRFEFPLGLICLIGARGTGKTTVLELVRYALDAIPGDQAARKRLEALVLRNLDSGRVEVGIETKDGMGYVVSRVAGEEPVVLTDDRKPTSITLKNGFFDANIYSQNEVEQIADRSLAQLDLIDGFERERIREVENEIAQAMADLEANATAVAPLQTKIAQWNEALSELPNIEAQLAGLTPQDSEDTKLINEAHAWKASRDRERRAVDTAAQFLGDYSSSAAELRTKLHDDAALSIPKALVSGVNEKTMADIARDMGHCATEVDALLCGVADQLALAQQKLTASAKELVLAHAAQDLEYRKVIEQDNAAQEVATERDRAERSKNELLTKQRHRDEAAQKLEKHQAARRKLMGRLSELRDQRFAIRKSVADYLNRTLSPNIRVDIKACGNTEYYTEFLENALKDAKVRTGQVAAKLAAAFEPAELVEVVETKDCDALRERGGLNDEQSAKVRAALCEPKVLQDLATVELPDQPKIELNDSGVYKDAAALSTGQKCTVILPILLLDSANPLLIDQPEDNLDNRFIYEAIVERIRKVKTRRQLFCLTHNANIPVLADAERIFVLESDGRTGRIATQGTVDQCKNEVVTLLEGGEEAFKKRKERYKY